MYQSIPKYQITFGVVCTVEKNVQVTTGNPPHTHPQDMRRQYGHEVTMECIALFTQYCYVLRCDTVAWSLPGIAEGTTGRVYTFRRLLEHDLRAGVLVCFNACIFHRAAFDSVERTDLIRKAAARMKLRFPLSDVGDNLAFLMCVEKALAAHAAVME